MYSKEDFYVDNGYIVILGSKTYKLSYVVDIFLRGESMFLDFTDGTRGYERITVTRENIAVLVEFLNEFKVAKEKELQDFVDSVRTDEVGDEEESTKGTSDTLLFVVLIVSLLLNVYLLLF